jgi:hypothetical protein
VITLSFTGTSSGRELPWTPKGFITSVYPPYRLFDDLCFKWPQAIKFHPEFSYFDRSMAWMSHVKVLTMKKSGTVSDALRLQQDCALY